jgi:hypothetical protein
MAALPAILAIAGVKARPPAADPLKSEIVRWSAWVRDTSSKDELIADARQSMGPLLARAEKAEADGRRGLALFRFAAARGNLAAAEWAASRPKAEREELPAFKAEWRRAGSTLGRAPKVEGALPVAVAAMAEIAAMESQSYYDAALSYGECTAPLYGLYYLGLASGQSDLARWLGALPAPAPRRAITLRSPAPEIERLQKRLLEAYRPPLSIDRHPEFIRASAALKEARELDAAGLRRGALLEVLYAALRAAPLLKAPALDTSSLEPRVAELERRIAHDGRDHGIGELFLQLAREDLASGAHPTQAASVVAEVMPVYFAALGPAAARAAARPARVTVTLVRWPYT